MPEWKAGIRKNLPLGDLGAARQEEIVEDLAQQLDDAYQDALGRGMSDAGATAFAWDQCRDWTTLSRELQRSRRGAVTAIGRLEERAHDVPNGGGWRSSWRGLSGDLLFGLRMMRKAPGFTAVAVVTLALGIGANTTIFSVINSTLLQPLPFPEPGRLALVWQADRDKRPDHYNIVSAPVFWEWQRQNRVFERLAIFDSAGKGYNLAAAGEQREGEQVSGVRVTAGFFSVLGVNPFLGRGFRPEEELAGNDRVVVLSHGLWTRRYGADRSIVGRPIRIDGENRIVVGVMPRTFRFQFWSEERELWVPAGWSDGDRSRGSNSFVAIARLRPGVTMAAADAELGNIQARLKAQYDDVHPSAAVVPLAGFGLESVQRISMVLLGAVGFVLLIGCVNVANLMLARGAERRKEFAIRRALGASAPRVLRQLLAESALLSALGGAAGLALAYWGTTLLTRVLPRDFSFIPLRPLGEVILDGTVLAFTFGVTAVTGVLFGIAPAVAAARADLWRPLKDGGRESGRAGRNKLRHGLVASEVALTLVVLVAAGLMIKSMVRLVGVDPGFDPKNVVTMEISLPQANIYYGPPDHPRFCQDLEDRVGSVPGVQSVGAAAHLPMRGNAGRGFLIEGRPTPAREEEPGGSYTVACPGYFRTLGVRVLEGREFTGQDTTAAPGVVLINEALAKEYWPNEDPVGKRISITADGPGHWLTIVGVVGNVRHWGLSQKVRGQLFRPYTQAAWPWLHVVARTATAPAAFVQQIKQAMATIEPDRPVASVRTMEDVVRGSVGSRRFPMLMLAAFACLALVLAAVGIIGVVSFAVTQRIHEIGIRVALGAQQRHVIWMMVRGSMSWVLLGVAAGSAASLLVSRLLSGLLYEVTPGDPTVLAAVVVTLSLVALAASWVPARRATKVDPLVALRSE